MKIFLKSILLVFLLFGCAQETPVGITSNDIATAADGSLPSFFQCLRDNDVTLVSAHRGGPAKGYPENALETFENTTSRAASIVELDVVRSKDGKLFLLHDDTLERTTTLSGKVNDHNWTEIKEALLKDNFGTVTGFHPPSLMETLIWAKEKVLLQIDMKPPLDVNLVVDEVVAAGAEGRVFYIAYSTQDAKKILEKLPNAFVSLGIANQNELDHLISSGIQTRQIHSLTPNIEENKSFLKTLNDAGITTVGLTFDLALENAKSTKQHDWNEVVKQYQARANSGIEILASNKPIDAFKALSQQLDYQKSLKACLAGL